MQPAKVWGPDFNTELVLLSWETGSISTDNLSAYDVIVNKAHKIAGRNFVTAANEESCP